MSETENTTKAVSSLSLEQPASKRVTSELMSFPPKDEGPTSTQMQSAKPSKLNLLGSKIVHAVRLFTLPQATAIVFSLIVLISFVSKADFHGIDSVDFNYARLGDKDKDKDRIKDLYDRRMKQYADDQISFATNMKLQGIALVFASFLLCKKLEKVEIKGFGFELPAKFVQACLPATMVYLWLNFGYLLHELILDRTILWHIISERDALMFVPGSGETAYSAHRLLRDNFFVDDYFLAFIHELTEIKEGGMWILNRAITCGFGVFWGTVQGCAIATVANVIDEGASTHARKILGFSYMFAVCTLLLASHLQFNLAGHPNWLQSIILASCVVSTVIYCLASSVSRSVANEYQI